MRYSQKKIPQKHLHTQNYSKISKLNVMIADNEQLVVNKGISFTEAYIKSIAQDTTKPARQQAKYKLDVGVRRECESEADTPSIKQPPRKLPCMNDILDNNSS